MNPRTPDNVVFTFPPHPDTCDVCGDTGQVRWCGMHRRQSGDWVSSHMGMPGSCLPLPVLDVPFRVDVPSGSSAGPGGVA